MAVDREKAKELAMRLQHIADEIRSENINGWGNGIQIVIDALLEENTPEPEGGATILWVGLVYILIVGIIITSTLAR